MRFENNNIYEIILNSSELAMRSDMIMDFPILLTSKYLIDES